MPMQRWIASAAGGTSQRLNPGFATVLALSRSPAFVAPSKVVPVAVMCTPLFLGACSLTGRPIRFVQYISNERLALEFGDGAHSRRVQSGMAAVDIGDDFPNHLRGPVTAQMVRGAVRRLVFRHRLEIIADLVGHTPQLLHLGAAHAASSPSRAESGPAKIVA